MINWLNERTGIKDLIEKQLKYPVPSHANIWFCFGGLAFFLIILQVVTGVFMMFFYIPDAAKVRDNIKFLCTQVPYGGFIRNFHRWSATLIVAFLFIHTVNVITRRAYRSPRELNWWSGILLFLLMLLLMATGIILPWDWRSYWELIVWADWFGTIPLIGKYLVEPLISYFAVNRSFILHVWILPAIVALVLIFHLRMVRKLGVAEPL